MGKFIDGAYAAKTVGRRRERIVAFGLFLAGLLILLFSSILKLREGIYVAGFLLILGCAFDLKAWSHYFKR